MIDKNPDAIKEILDDETQDTLVLDVRDQWDN